MRVAIIHYWLVGMRGGEKVLEALCEMYPQADIFTHVVVPEAISERIARHRIKTSFIAKLPRAHIWYKKYLPLMPIALEHLDLRDYDLVISSESGPAKGVIPAPGALHVCYCHSPMRYVWNMYHDYRQTAGSATRMSIPLAAHYLRNWDQNASARVDTFVANSHNVASRVQKYYRRDAEVVYPPVDIAGFARSDSVAPGDFYLMVGELVAYKRPDLAVHSFNATGAPLVVIGGGEMLEKLRRDARPNVKILGPQPFAVLKDHYARCKGLIFPGEEDFGIVPVEAMAGGRPVIAFGQGGALETVIDGQTGILFHEQSVEALLDAIERANATSFDAARIANHAAAFSVGRFKQEMSAAINRAFVEHSPARVRQGRIGLAEDRKRAAYA
ncbi:GDP-mannose-dependent alpha-(1-6)-phosphatidylinositol monomannoside mannosyltransferase [Variibacter gotjawalensis]|uniref:GDP-mannose-dependent alpha-(1-6)-phosphatidylinositol monomannoside mannosyltransferase n=1 Tax=Variibacter gotjawalensis TaxID=1333996 RepID=A0A0S3PZW4_9BRAD|nr:glycosyltransferase [Variibacter gotjawalensis]NIK47317.1 glycosyltransferase involved in cell wall biosynthesis [Variibacter gotjawalensis]RZS49215.1 glycosyltransferase involved in cell wall biosynthesis [Variibacter gotjawalensis]BAT61477.1 GDP-mannose-dependent alpha-(1-6)-phosphatidylinositol monomannoside mannosyltransferase [Variibacter gotjawalensis]